MKGRFKFTYTFTDGERIKLLAALSSLESYSKDTGDTYGARTSKELYNKIQMAGSSTTMTDDQYRNLIDEDMYLHMD